MNRTVRYIFNENFTKKKRFVSIVNSAWDPLKTSQKKKNNEMHTLNAKRYIQTDTKQLILYIYFKNVAVLPLTMNIDI